MGEGFFLFFFFDRNFATAKTIKLVKARAGKVSVKGLFCLRSICCRMLRLLEIRLGYVGIIVYTLLSTFSPLALKNRKMSNVQRDSRLAVARLKPRIAR